MDSNKLTRRQFLHKSGKLLLGGAAAGVTVPLLGSLPIRDALSAQASLPQPGAASRDVVSIVKIKKGNIPAAVEEAIDLLGGVKEVAKNKQRVMLKPNIVSENPRSTTKRPVVQTLAQLLKKDGKEVLIGEGSAAAMGFNVSAAGEISRTKKQPLIDDMQKYVFDQLGYTELARSLDTPLINLHSGDMASIDLPQGLAYKQLSIHHSLTEIDLLCSVPMMKTHSLAGVTLGMKNLVGLYPGTVYGTVRAGVHDHAANQGSPGIAYEILDMVKANKLGLVVVDGSSAMEGNGPSMGTLLDMNVIIAGTNPLATDMVAARVMGYEPHEIPTFVTAQRIGMKPGSLDEIEIRGAGIETVTHPFIRPQMYRWQDIRDFWGVKEILYRPQGVKMPECSLI